MTNPDEASGPVNLGEVVGVHGVRGAVKVRVFNDETAALTVGAEVTLHVGEAARVYELERVSPTPGKTTWRLWLAGVGDRESAEALVGASVVVPRQVLPPPRDDEFYLADVIGFRVEQSGVGLGEVVGVTDNGAQDLLEVRWGDVAANTWLLPVLPQFLTEVDTAAKRLRVDMPEGMLPEPLEREVSGAR